MRQLFGIIIFVPLAFVIGFFAVENRAPLALEIWPLPGIQEMWASVWILGLLAIGIIVGLTIGWIAGGSTRRRARRAERLNRTLERQLAEHNSEPDTVPASATSIASPNAPGGTPGSAMPAPAGRAAQIARVDD